METNTNKSIWIIAPLPAFTIWGEQYAFDVCGFLKNKEILFCKKKKKISSCHSSKKSNSTDYINYVKI